MPVPATLFLAPTGADAGVLAAQIAEAAGGAVEGPTTERRTVLDTFDWRVQRGGLALERVAVGGDALAVLRPWGQAAPIASAPLRAEGPLFAADLPSGRLADRVAPLLDVRALDDVVAYDVAVHLVVVRNADAKVVARVAVDDLGAGHVVVRALAVRGYDRAAAKARKAIAAARCDATDDDPVVVALQRAGRRPGDRGGKLAVGLDGSGSAAAGWVAVLRALLDEVEANVPGTIADVDTEFLHDLRVAVRRSRSALRHAHGIFPSELLDCFRPELRWLQEVTGPSRDLDVYVLSADDEMAAVAGSDRSSLEPFRAFLDERRADAHRQLNHDLESPAAHAILTDWRHTLDSLAESMSEAEAGEWGDWPEGAHRALADVVAHRIRRQHRKLVKDGKAITETSPAHQLHDLRKRGKELRYLLELFGSVTKSDRTASFVKALKGLQDVLGEFQDTEVQVTELRGWADELAAGGATAAPTLLAMGELVERLQQRQDAARHAFAVRFSRFVAAGEP